jgi:transcriptional regulator
VPTWNYVAVEAEGRLERLSRDALIAQIDALGDEHEARLAPKPAWMRDKVPAAAYERMLAAIEGYVIRVEAWRGTGKLSQNKPAVDRTGVADALDALRRVDLAAAVRAAR